MVEPWTDASTAALRAIDAGVAVVGGIPLLRRAADEIERLRRSEELAWEEAEIQGGVATTGRQAYEDMERQRDALETALAAEREESYAAGECLNMVAETLKAFGCEHGSETHKATPPMMYPEWIACVVRHAVAAEREKVAKCLERLEAVDPYFDQWKEEYDHG